MIIGQEWWDHQDADVTCCIRGTLLLYVMMGVAPEGTKLAEVVRAAMPFLACGAILVALLIMFPAFALTLPKVMLN